MHYGKLIVVPRVEDCQSGKRLWEWGISCGRSYHVCLADGHGGICEMLWDIRLGPFQIAWMKTLWRG